MERTDSVSAGRIFSTAAAVILASLFLAGSPAWATFANFDEVDGFGFDSKGLGDPALTIYDYEVDFYGATDVLQITTGLCFLLRATEADAVATHETVGDHRRHRQEHDHHLLTPTELAHYLRPLRPSDLLRRTSSSGAAK